MARPSYALLMSACHQLHLAVVYFLQTEAIQGNRLSFLPPFAGFSSPAFLLEPGL